MNSTIFASRRLGWLAAAALLALGVAGLWTVKATHEISLTQADIQAHIDRQLGKEIAIKGAPGAPGALLQSIRIKSATVTLRDGKAALAADIEGALRTGKSFEIEASALGTPKYAEGALYFDPEKVDVRRLTYEGQSLADLVSRLARSHVADVAGEKARVFLEEKARKADDWATAAVDAALRRFLEERPVYRLKDDTKGAVMKAALEEVRVENDRILVTFSLWRLTATTVAGALSLLLGIILSILIVRMILIGEDIEISAS